MRNIILHSLIMAGSLSISLNAFAIDNAASSSSALPSQTQETMQNQSKELKATQSGTTMNQNTTETKKRISGHKNKHHAKKHGHKHNHAKHHGHKHHVKHHGHKHHGKKHHAKHHGGKHHHGHPCHYKKHGNKHHSHKSHAHGHKHNHNKHSNKI